MRNVSNKYIEAMQTRRDFYPVAQITFADGTEKTLEKGDFTMSGNSITESAESSSFPLGILAAKRITISLMNDDDRWSEYDFYGAKIFLRTNFDLDDGTTETLNIGTFTVVTPENYGTTVVITAMDDSYKTDIDYSTGLSYPISAGEALRDSCRTCGIALQTSTFKNDNYIIPTMPQNLTHRQFIGMIAMIAGGNAVFDENNRLVIKTYDFSEFEKAGLDGGIFDAGTPRYETGDDADGGSFNPWDTGYVMDGGQFGDRNNLHMLYEFKSGITIGVDDVVITGVQIDGEDEEGNKVPHLYGKDGYVLSLENQLAKGKEDEVVRLIGQTIVGLRFRPFSGDHIAYPLAEFMDLAYLIDRKNNVYQTVLTDVNFTYYGFTNLKCTADSPIRNSSVYYGNETKAIVQARNLVEKEKTDREKAIEGLGKRIDESSGLYSTEETQKDGSKIFYLHDKPKLTESMIVWKMTAEAWGVSTDGGKSYNAGMTVDGNTIVKILEAVGINADWIHAGTFEVGGSGKRAEFIARDENDVVICSIGTTCGMQGSFSSYGIDPNDITYSVWSEIKDGIMVINRGGEYVGSVECNCYKSLGLTVPPFGIYGRYGSYIEIAFKEEGGLDYTYTSAYAPMKIYPDRIEFNVPTSESSDERLKKDIKEINIQQASDFIGSLEPIFFRHKDNDTDLRAGLSAQKVEKAMIENGISDELSLVIKKPTQDENEYEYRLNYMELIPFLIAKTKQQDVEIESLKNEIKELKQMIGGVQ